MKSNLHQYMDSLFHLGTRVVVTDESADDVDCDHAISKIIDFMVTIRGSRNNKVMFVGNGGSAGIASHMAIDYSKNGRTPALAFNDGAALTCLSNDLGYANVFSEQIRLHAHPGDMLIAISSSGTSSSILNAVDEARQLSCTVITMSGFDENNPLRKMGDINWYVQSPEYGFVEILHLTLCHAILDTAMGSSVLG